MFTLNCSGRMLVVDKPVVMGILNVTPDSFFGGSRVTADTVTEQAGRMLEQGAGILDIGGQSTRPGSERVSASEETDRVASAIENIMKAYPDAVISIDTYHASVAAAAVRAGACIVNDISSGDMDADMLATVGRLHVPYIAMHMQGTPDTMQQHPVYEDVTRTVLDYFIQKMETCRLAGINDVILDPGIGFGKTAAHNFELIRNLKVFAALGKPLLLGVSRKGFIYRGLGITAEEALNGTTVMNTIGLMNGAMILRVHDVKEAIETVKLFEACYPLRSGQ
ncbi:MAG: dihydropteroate synthase [Pseudobacter sp.]|uniref:dihydropteroate synthase n=1 Tax=Pseudobacter sp. TaxID=2045420 RepID=UPI003F7D1817